MTTIISAVIAAGDFHSPDDASAYAAALRKAADDRHPGAVVNIQIIERQTGGGSVSVEIDGEPDDVAGEYLRQAAENAI